MARGSPVMIAAISDAWLSPANARVPVAISYSTQPSAQMSARASASRPSSCSGAMYWNVPTIAPSLVSGCVIVGETLSAAPLLLAGVAPTRANPKSISFAPVLVSITFPGFRSRCTTPIACARSSAEAISAPSLSTSATGNGPRATRCARVSPSSSSITR